MTTIAFSLFALGLFGLVALNIREALEQLEDRVEIRAFVARGTTPEDVGAGGRATSQASPKCVGARW